MLTPPLSICRMLHSEMIGPLPDAGRGSDHLDGTIQVTRHSFLQCVEAVWPECLDKLQNQPEEDTITINLVNLLSKDQLARRLFHWIEFHYVPYGNTLQGKAYSKGEIDIALFWDRDREKYLAYECKRLNVVHKGKKSSLATPYVMEGIKRFVTEQYADNLPVGCMLGYVLDGNVELAQSKIHESIEAKKSDIRLAAGPVQDKPVGAAKRFYSRHLRSLSGQEIEIRHTLLSFPKSA